LLQIGRIHGLVAKLLPLCVLGLALFLPAAHAQSFQAERQWALFYEILIIGIATGIVVFGLLFYAIIKYRERPEKGVEK